MNKKTQNLDGPEYDLLIMGQSTLDNIYREEEGYVFKLAPGGNAIYSVLGASIWPIRIAVVTRVGTDYPPKNLIRATCSPTLTDWRGIKYFDGPSIQDTVYYFKNGRRKYEFEDESLLDTLSPIPSDIPENMVDCSHVHVSAANVDTQQELLRFFKAHGAIVSLDVETHFFKGKESTVKDILALDPIFIPSIEHVLLLSDAKNPSPLDIWPWIRECGLSLTAVKCGSDGAWVFDAVKKECWNVGIVPNLTIADVTGAGDAFCGGFMAGLIRTRNPVLAAAYGSVSASFIVESWSAVKPPHYSPQLAASRLEQVIQMLPARPISLQ